MNRHKYTASLSQTQGRSGYSIIFRHPVRRSDATGKPGLRVRSGLGTRDEGEAARLRDELNVLLGNGEYHDPAARPEAERRFDPRVVNIFFDKMAPEETDFTALRDAAIELPESARDGYRRVLFLGTTGAGKTTLVRQLIGTDPNKERFPSTSTAKTTIHDTEIVLAEGGWRAVVTFASRDEVREYLSECVSDAVLAGARGADDAEMLRRLLNHANQRFRFSYVLGNGPTVASRISDFDDEDVESEDEEDLLSEVERGTIDVTRTAELLAETIKTLRSLASRHRDGLHAELEVGGDDDKRVADEIFEEELDNLLRDDQDFHQATDALMEEIEKRFELLPPGEVQKTPQGWPLAWSGEWPFGKRAEFLSAISLFLQQLRALVRATADAASERLACRRSLLSGVERKRGAEACPARWRRAWPHAQVVFGGVDGSEPPHRGGGCGAPGRQRHPADASGATRRHARGRSDRQCPKAHHRFHALRRGQGRQPAERTGKGATRLGLSRERARGLRRGPGSVRRTHATAACGASSILLGGHPRAAEGDRRFGQDARCRNFANSSTASTK